MKIALTGATGLIGSRLLELTKDQKGFEIIPLGKIQGFDIQNKDIVFDSLSKIKPDIIIHLAAKTNVDECEEDKAKDSETLINLKILEEKDSLLNFNNINYLVELKGTAFTVNTIGTKNLADFSLKNNTKLIYVSTDYVFSGNENYYTEESEAIPINWYGQTKLWGEEIVKKYLQNSLIVRLSNPYGYKNNIRKDFVWRFIELLETEKEVSLVCDQIITPTFIDDIVWGLFF